jgi:hypothetical protein
MEKVRFAMDDLGDDAEETYSKWIESYSDSLDELNALLNHYMGTTHTECSGQTRIAGEIMPKDVLGLVSTEALEGLARAVVQREVVE